MIQLLRNFICQKSTGKTVLFLFIITNLVYAFMLLVTIPKVMEFSGGLKLPDMMPTGYDIEYINSLLSSLGESGRHIYLYHQIPADMIYPLLFAVCYSLLFTWLLKKINQQESSFFYFSFLPLFSGISDYIENFGIITMLGQFPELKEETVIITNTFSMLKSTTTSFYFIALLVLIVLVVVKSVMKDREIRFR